MSDFLSSDLASWLAVLGIVVAIGISLWLRRGPSSSMSWGRWSAKPQPPENPQYLEIAGRIHVAPSGSSFLLKPITASAQFDGGPSVPLEEEHRYDLQPEREGATTIELTFRPRDTAALNSRHVKLDVAVALADGVRKRTRETIQVQANPLPEHADEAD